MADFKKEKKDKKVTDVSSGKKEEKSKEFSQVKDFKNMYVIGFADIEKLSNLKIDKSVIDNIVTFVKVFSTEMSKIEVPKEKFEAFSHIKDFFGFIDQFSVDPKKLESKVDTITKSFKKVTPIISTISTSLSKALGKNELKYIAETVKGLSAVINDSFVKLLELLKSLDFKQALKINFIVEIISGSIKKLMQIAKEGLAKSKLSLNYLENFVNSIMSIIEKMDMKLIVKTEMFNIVINSIVKSTSKLISLFNRKLEFNINTIDYLLDSIKRIFEFVDKTKVIYLIKSKIFSSVLTSVVVTLFKTTEMIRKFSPINESILTIFPFIREAIGVLERMSLGMVVKSVLFYIFSGNVTKSLNKWNLLLSGKYKVELLPFETVLLFIKGLLGLIEKFTLGILIKSKIFNIVTTSTIETILKISGFLNKIQPVEKEKVSNVLLIISEILKYIETISLVSLIKSMIFKSLIGSLISSSEKLFKFLESKININTNKYLKILDVVKVSLELIEKIKKQKIKSFIPLMGTSKKAEKVLNEFTVFTKGLIDFIDKYNIAHLIAVEKKMKIIHSTVILVIGTISKIFRTLLVLAGMTVLLLLTITTFSVGSLMKLAFVFGTLLVILRAIAARINLMFRINMFARSLFLLSASLAILALAIERFKPMHLLMLAGILGILVGFMMLLKFVTIGRMSHRTLGEMLMFIGLGILAMGIGIHFFNFKGLLIFAGVLLIILAFMMGLKFIMGMGGGMFFLSKFARDFGIMFVGIGLGFLAMAIGLQNFNMQKVLVFALVLGVILMFMLITSKLGGFKLGGPAKTYLALGFMLMAIGLGLVIMGLALKIFTMEDAFKFALIMGVLAISIFLISKSPIGFFAMIGLAIFVVALGFGFAMLGLALKLFTMESAGIFAIVMGVITGIAALAILAGPLSLLGVGVLIGIGIGMIIIGIGLMKIAEGIKALMEVSQGDPKKLSILTDIVDIINESLSKMSLWNALKVPTLKSIGEGLVAIASGIKSFWDIISSLPSKAFRKVGDKWAEDSLPGSLKNIISVITEVFGEMGKSGNKNASLMGILIGVDFRPSDVKVGINSILNINEALTSLVEGLKTFWNYIGSLPPDVFKKSGGKWSESSLPFRLNEILSGISEVFSSIGASGNKGFSLAKLVLGSDLRPSDVKVGINSILNIKDALISLTEGLKAFWSYIGSLPPDVFKKEGDRWASSSLPFRLNEILSGISEVFSSIGASGNKGFSIVKLIVGSDLKPSDVKVGINSILNIKDALISLTEGLKAFWNYIGSLPEEVFKKEGDRWSPNSLPFRLKEILMALAEIFTSIGTSGNSSFSILKLIAGSDIKQSDVKTGINSILDINKAMFSVVEGLKAFWEFITKIPPEYFEVKDGKFSERSLPYKLTTIISSLQSIFSSIGKDRTPSYFEGIFGFTWSKSEVERGISSFKDLGNVMKGVIESLKSYADLEKNYQLDINKVNENLVKILTSFGKSFVEMYKETDENWSMIEEGIGSFKNLHTVLLGIANAVKSFADLRNYGIKEDDFDPDKPGTIAYNIKSIVLSLSNVFIDIAKRIKEEEKLDIFGKVANLISDRPNMVKKAIESFTGVGEILMGIARAVDMFSKMKYYDEKEKKYVDIRIDEITKNISTFISSLADVFIKVSEKNTDKIKEAVDSFQNIGNIFNSLNELLKTSINIFKEKIDISSLSSTLGSIITFQYKLVKAVSGAGFTKESVELFGYDLYSGISNPAEFTNIAIFNINSIKKIVENTKSLIDSIKGINTEGLVKFDMRPLFNNLEFVMKKFQSDYNGYNTLAMYFLNLTKLNPTLSSFLDNYKIYNNLIKNYVDSINNLRLENINKIIESEKILKDLLTSDKAWIKDVLEILNQIIYNIGNLSGETYDKLKELLQQLKETLLAPLEQATSTIENTITTTTTTTTTTPTVAPETLYYYQPQTSMPKSVDINRIEEIITILRSIEILLQKG